MDSPCDQDQLYIVYALYIVYFSVYTTPIQIIILFYSPIIYSILFSDMFYETLSELFFLLGYVYF